MRRQEQDDLRKEQQQQKHAGQHQQHWEGLLDDCVERRFSYIRGYEQQEPERRRTEPYHHVQADEHAEIDQIYAHLVDDGDHHRQEDVLEHGRVEEHSQYQEQYVDEYKDQQLLVRDTQDQPRYGGGDIFLDHRVGKYRRGSRKYRDRAGRLHRIGNGDQKFAPAEHPVRENRDQQRIESGDGARLRRRHDACVDADKQDDGRQQRRDRAKRKAPELRAREDDALRIASPFGHVGDIKRKRASYQKGRHHAAQEKRADRGAREHRVDHERNAGRKDRADDGAGGRNCAAERQIVAVLFHCVYLHRADAGSVRDGRTGHAGEDERDQHVDVGQGAAPFADQGLGKVEHDLGDLAAVHDICREDKERYGDEHIAAVKHSHDLPHDQANVGLIPGQVEDAGGNHPVGDRHIENEGQHHHGDYDQQLKFKDRLLQNGFNSVEIPKHGDTFTL